MSLFSNHTAEIAVTQKRADRTFLAPASPGLYAWYLKPAGPSFKKLMTNLAHRPVQLDIQARLSYGIQVIASAAGEYRYTSVLATAKETIDATSDETLDAMRAAASLLMVPTFTSPIYIGIAQNLRKRLYDQHYSQLQEHWEPDSLVSRYLDAHPDISPDKAIATLCSTHGLKHTFALSARVRSFDALNLFAYFAETSQIGIGEGEEHDDEQPGADTPQTRRAAERIFQIICNPLCGRM